MDKNKKLEKIRLNELEIKGLCGGQGSNMQDWTYNEVPTSSNGNWGDCDVTVTYDGGCPAVDYSKYISCL